MLFEILYNFEKLIFTILVSKIIALHISRFPNRQCTGTGRGTMSTETTFHLHSSFSTFERKFLRADFGSFKFCFKVQFSQRCINIVAFVSQTNHYVCSFAPRNPIDLKIGTQFEHTIRNTFRDYSHSTISRSTR